MERNRIIAALATGEKALRVYDGASNAWGAFGNFRSGAERLGLVGESRTPGELAIAALFTGVISILVLTKD